MRLLLHLASKDVQHLRVEVILWFALVALDSLLFGVGPEQTARTWDPGSGTSVIVIALTVLLAAQLAQIDSKARSGAFWRTRPIGRSQMASEKLGLAFVLLAGWPAVTDSVAALALGLPFREVLGTAGVTLVNQLFLVLPTMAVASFRPDLVRFIIAAIGVGIGLALWVRLLAGLAWLLLGVSLLTKTVGAGLSAMTGALAVLSALAVWAFWFKHATRRSRRGWMAFVAGIAAWPLLLIGWQWDITRPVAVRPGWSAADAAVISLEVAGPLWVHDELESMAWYRSQSASVRERIPVLWHAPVGFRGLPHGFYAEPVRIVSRTIFADGSRVDTDLPASVRVVRISASSEPGPGGVEPGVGQVPAPVLPPSGPASQASIPSVSAAMAAAISDSRWTRSPSDDELQMTPALLAVPRQLDRPDDTVRATVDAAVTFDAWRFAPVLRFAPRRGERATTSGTTLEVLDVRPWRRYADPDLLVLLQDRGLRRHDAVTTGRLVKSKFVLVNRQQREALAGDLQDGPYLLRHFAPALPSLMNGTTTLSFTVDRALESETTRLTDAWLAEAEIVRLDPVYLGSFTRPLRQVVELPKHPRPRWPQ